MNNYSYNQMTPKGQLQNGQCPKKNRPQWDIWQTKIFEKNFG